MNHHYTNTSIINFLEREKKERDREQIEEDAAAASRLEFQEHIYSYPDGTVYMGQMRRVNTNGDDSSGSGLSHVRHGRGTLRTPAFVYGMPLKEYTSDEAAENAHLAKWHEYAGTWNNDKLHGYGVHVQKSGGGAEIVIFEGIWNDGKPMKTTTTIHADDDADADADADDTVFS
jgi:hypothetical protein